MSEMERNELIEAVEAGELKIQAVQPRWKSWAVWVSVLGAVWTILSAFGLPEKWGIPEGTFRSVVDALGIILVGFGILNNPTDPENF